MKKLIWTLVLPLTIISFVIFTKWWYVDIIDGTDEILIGFPFPYLFSCWHTSLCFQISISDLIINILTYFAFWFIIVLLIHQFIDTNKLNKVVTKILLSLAAISLIGLIFLGSFFDNIYRWNREFEMKELESGYKFLWEENYQPNYYKHHPEMKK